jgi:hypothetical protein
VATAEAEPEEVYIRYDIADNIDTDYEVIKVASFHIHPMYNDEITDYDVAVLVLATASKRVRCSSCPMHEYP